MITLGNRTYRAVRDAAGQIVIIVRAGNAWRVAPARDAAKVLAGLHAPMLRVAS